MTLSGIHTLLLLDESGRLRHHGEQRDAQSPDVVASSCVSVVSKDVRRPVRLGPVRLVTAVDVDDSLDIRAVGHGHVDRIPRSNQNISWFKVPVVPTLSVEVSKSPGELKHHLQRLLLWYAICIVVDECLQVTMWAELQHEDICSGIVCVLVIVNVLDDVFLYQPDKYQLHEYGLSFTYVVQISEHGGLSAEVIHCIRRGLAGKHASIALSKNLVNAGEAALTQKSPPNVRTAREVAIPDPGLLNVFAIPNP